MSDQETTRQVEHFNSGDSHDDLSKLSEQARHAFEQQRTTDCLDLTRAILLIDPENAEAQALRNSMRTALHQDLEKARSLVRAPDASRTGTHVPAAAVPASDFRRPAPFTRASNASASETPSQPVESEEAEAVPLLREALAQRRASSEPAWRPRMLDVAAALVVLALAIAAVPMYRSLTYSSTPAAAESSVETQAADSTLSPGLELSSPQTGPVLEFEAAPETATPPSAEQAPAALDLVASQPANARPSAVTAPQPPPASVAVEATPEPSVRPQGKGTLAVSAPLATEIYVDGRHVGSAPASLELPAGTHTLEYRHGTLRKSVAHAIRPGQTTLATITFDVSVSINASPWANVFLGGAEKKLLGQTPLGGVQLPVGSELIFENPKFETQRRRVTGTDSRIQVSFP